MTLAPGAREKIAFTVRVPAGTPRRQYLAGITAELANKPKATIVGQHGKATAKAIIIRQVTVGVAVTVGNLSQMRNRLEIPGVSGQAIGTMPRLNVALRDTGQTFSGGTGQASCTSAGKTHSFRVATNTILPGDQAQIAVNAPSLREGTTVPCVVRIHYGNGQTVRWSGMVTLPKAAAARIVHTGPGAYSVIPENGIPGWAIALIVVGGVAIAGVAVLLIRVAPDSPPLIPAAARRAVRAGSGSPCRARSAGAGAGPGRPPACAAARPCGSAGSGCCSGRSAPTPR